MPRYAISLAVLATFVCGACGAGSEALSPSPGMSLAAVYFPTHVLAGSDPMPTALADGTLIVVGECVALEWPDGKTSLLLWPPGFAAVAIDGQTVIHDARQVPVAEAGRPVTVGGGEIDPADHAYVRDLIGEEPPSECRLDAYWLVSKVVSPPP